MPFPLKSGWTYNKLRHTLGTVLEHSLKLFPALSLSLSLTHTHTHLHVPATTFTVDCNTFEL